MPPHAPALAVLTLTSGDLIADRRAAYAQMLAEAADFSAAADLMRQALELAPAWTAGHFRLGELCEVAGELGAAEAAWRCALRLDPADPFGAGLRLAAHGFAVAPASAPPAYVETLYDAYAEKFETSLVERLEYGAPQALMAAIDRADPGRAFHDAVDLGCGTGLMGERLRRRVSHISGIDLSEKMLAKAGRKGIYDRLVRANLSALSLGQASLDLVVAADVFIYLGALDTVFANVAAALEPGGLFVFSTEAGDEPLDFRLLPSLRYAHSPAYLRRALAAAGFDVLSVEAMSLRHDRGEPVPGLVVAARRATGGVSAEGSGKAPGWLGDIPVLDC